MPAGASNADNPAKDQPLAPGAQLKVLRGPFNAVVHLDKHELTLMVQGRYAGRFAIGVGPDVPKLEGSYTVRDKRLNPIDQAAGGANFQSSAPGVLPGNAWIGLGDRLGIHGTDDPQAVGRDDPSGAICVTQRDLQDLYGIVSVGSRVTIVR